MGSQELDKQREFVNSLQFGDVFSIKLPSEQRQIVFLRPDQPDNPNCLQVKGDVRNGNYTIHDVGTVTLRLIIPNVIKRLTLTDIESHYQPMVAELRESNIRSIREASGLI